MSMKISFINGICESRLKREYGTNGNNWERRSQLFPFVPYSLFVIAKSGN